MGEPIEKIQVFSSKNVNLTIVDTLLIIQKGEERFLEIYSTNSHELLAKLGTEGRGPNEFINPELLKQVTYTEIRSSTPYIHIYDYSLRRFTTVNLYDAIKGSISAINQKNLPPQLKTDIPYFYYYNNDYIIGAPGTGFRFFIHNLKTSETKFIPYIPQPNYHIQDEYLSQIYRSALVINDSKDIIATAPIGFGRIDFFDLEGNYLRSSIYNQDDNNLESNLVNHSFGDIFYNIVHLESQNNEIFALNYNNTAKNLVDSDLQSPIELQVYNWDGEPVKKFIFSDKRKITSFAYDKIHKRIYSYCPGEEDYNLVIYNLDI